MASETQIRKPAGFADLILRHPAGFWFIFWGELAERCSYYGMMALLPRFIAEFLNLGDGASNTWVSLFKAACYFLPLLGGFLADQYLGKYRLIVIFSIPYILGHVALAGETINWTLLALALLAMGSGVIKPNISTLMGLTYDQKRPGDDALRSMAFGMFYMAINIGAAISYIALPVIRDEYGYGVAFMCPAVLMGISFLIFAAGKPHYAVEKIERHVSTPEERNAKIQVLLRVGGLFLVITVFWAVFDQSHTTWIFFTRDFTDLSVFGMRLSTEQVGFINPLLIVVFVPVLAAFWLMLANRGIIARPTDKIMLGFFLTAGTMGVMALAGMRHTSYEDFPSLRATSEKAPVLVATPKLDTAAVKALGKQIEANDQSAEVTNVTEVQLIWVPQAVTLTKKDLGPDGWELKWGNGEDGKITLKGSAAIRIESSAEYVYVAKSSAPFTATYSLFENAKGEKKYKLIAGTKRVVAPDQKVSLWWIVLAFVLLTLAEVLISVTGLELAFVVSPANMKGFVTALWLLTVGLANLVINAPVGRLYATMPPGPYFALLSGMTVAIIVVFFFVARYFNSGSQTKA